MKRPVGPIQFRPDDKIVQQIARHALYGSTRRGACGVPFPAAAQHGVVVVPPGILPRCSRSGPVSGDVMQQVLAILNDLKAGQKTLEAGQARLEAGQTSLEDRQIRLETGQTSLRVDLMARMDRREDMNTKIRDDIAVNFGTADAVRRANDNTREELRALSEVVSLMHRQISRLQTEVEQMKGSA
ncbi:hypothetical protein [Rhodopila globiformis]|nr:hypothetical protein [Rhodopila globiformis]